MAHDMPRSCPNTYGQAWDIKPFFGLIFTFILPFTIDLLLNLLLNIGNVS